MYIKLIRVACLLEITSKILQLDGTSNNKNSILGRIKEITLEAFSREFTDQILRLQADLRQEQSLNDQIRREYIEREEAVI